MVLKEQLANIVGAGNVSDEQATLDGYARDISFVNTVKPDWVVKPRNAKDIQQLVKLANETLTPLVSVSSGPPHFRGDTVPSTGGAIIVDLTGLKKIVRVDRYHRVAMVEAGVTFGELIPSAKKEGIRLNMPLLPKKSKSVVGSLLEREPVIMPKYQWDISDPLACMGLIFGTGDEFRTGQAAGPGTIEEQWVAGGAQKAPYGPGPVGWHRLIQGAQGTMGVVTWASLRCELLPSLEEPFLIGSASLDKLIDLTQWLLRRRLVNECFILNQTNLATIFARQRTRDYRDSKNGLPRWVLFFNIAGYTFYPEDRVSYQKKDILSLTQQQGLTALKEMGGITANELLKMVQRPSNDPHWKLRSKGACQDLFFLTINDKIAGLIGAMDDAADEAGYPAPDMGIYIQPMVQGTSLHCEFNLFYDPGNAAEEVRVRDLSNSATKALMARGAFFSRPYGESASTIINRDAATVVDLAKIKKILDPNNVLNPGKLCF